MWTSYRLSNPNITSISGDGLITARQKGLVYVTAVNEGASAVVGITVSPKDKLTKIIGLAVDTNGVPIVGANVILGNIELPPVSTDENGEFRFVDVPTEFGAIELEVRWIANGRLFTDFIRLDGVPGGVTEAGILTLKPLKMKAAQTVSAGSALNLAVRQDGTLWGWGDNAAGQLGDGSTDRRFSPVAIGSDLNKAWLGVSVGFDHSLALASDGTLWGWGNNNRGQIGDTTSTPRLSPVQVGKALNKRWVELSAGILHSAAIASDGTLWSWGYNAYGLGNGTVSSLRPAQVGENLGKTWVSVQSGEDHSMAVATDGTLWGWGRNDYGQLGDGSTNSSIVPVTVATNLLKKWIQVGMRNFFTVALAEDGTLWAWGLNNSGQLGDGTEESTLFPVEIGGSLNKKFTAFSAGSGHSLALADDGSLWGWGWNDYGQLGDVSSTRRLSPVRISNWLSKGWRAASVGANHSLALASDGSLWVWGDGSAGQFGDETAGIIDEEGTFYGAKLTPVQVATNPTFVVRMADGKYYSHTVLGADEGIWIWGRNFSDQSSDFRYFPYSLPNNMFNDGQIGANGAVKKWSALSSGSDFRLALEVNGVLWGWGENGSGQLGNGTVDTALSPIHIDPPENKVWLQVSAGSSHTVAIANDGSLWEWGYPLDPHLPYVLTPRQVRNSSGKIWTKISAGEDYNLALSSDGILWSWGDNTGGEGGYDRTLRQTSTPTRVNISPGIAEMSAGRSLSLAITTNGILWGWGSGGVGDGTISQRFSPVSIGGSLGKTWALVSSGVGHKFALATDGTLWGWGQNDYGQLGDGTSEAKLSPVQVAGDVSKNWLSVTAGEDFSLAIATDGTLWAWGLNNAGQLGIGPPYAQVLGGSVWGPSD
jgi:alpha-tubulin suppressor-like RCC1 family protein